jgi:ankyrin repeat protein
LLRDEDYASSLRDWLDVFAPGSLLILDEAHNAAPASGARYANRGADVNQAVRVRGTALIAAADVNQIVPGVESALRQAREDGHGAVVRLLLQHGARP